METPPPPIDPSLLDPHKRSLRPGVSPPAAKHAVPTKPPQPNQKPPVSRPTPPSPQKSIPLAAGAAKPSTTESKSEKPSSKDSSKQASATGETQKRPSVPLAGSKAPENGAKSQPPEDSSDQPNGKDGSGMAAWIAATIILALFVIVCVAASKNTEIENLKREIAQLTERESVQERETTAQTRKADERAERIGRLEKLLVERNETIARKEREFARLEREKAALQSEIVDLQSDKSDALRRASSAESELASEMNRATAATNRAREAERQLAATRKSSSSTATKPSGSSPPGKVADSKDAWVVVSATVDGKPVTGAKLELDWRQISLPQKFKVKHGSKTKSATVWHMQDGVYREGRLAPRFVDWTGEKRITVPLLQVDVDDDFDLDRALRSSSQEGDPW